MKEFEGTPGPWVSCGSIYQDYGYHVKTADKYTICMGINEASNANLIAAAPDLLKALQDVLSGFESFVDADWNPTSKDDEDLIKNARAAIAKALGESQ